MHKDKAWLLDRFFRNTEVRDSLSLAEKRSLVEASGEIRSHAAGTDIVREGDTPVISTLLISGFASRYKMTEGGARQITSVHVPGDFVDLQSLPLRRMDHSVGALTDCEVIYFPHSELQRAIERHPHLARLFLMLTGLDAAIHRAWLVSMGRTSALSHTAHFICETYRRLEIVGLAAGNAMSIPLTQSDLADVLGISAVHVNRVLQELRTMGMIRWNGHHVCILDWDRLKKTGQFDDRYLFIERLSD
jgi:CRP-like cAMP-binding protein